MPSESPEYSFPAPWQEKEEERERELQELRRENARLQAEKKGLLDLAASQDENLHEQYQRTLRDPLTGLLNRRGLEGRLKTLFPEPEPPAGVRHRRTERHDKPPGPMSVFFGDIDDYGAFNKKYGEEIGDAVLKVFAEKLQNLAKRDKDIVCRYGGEELVMVLPDSTPEEAIKIFQDEMSEEERNEHPNEGRFSFALELPALNPDKPPEKINVTISGAFTKLIPGNHTSKDAVELFEKSYKMSEKIMQEIKRRGKNKILIEAPEEKR